MNAAARVSDIPAGNEALILAADGALPAFSVGAEPTDWTIDAEGVLIIAAADWQELSLLTFGAFPTATVATVTATQPDEGIPMITTADPATLPVNPDDDALFATAADHAEPDQLPGIDPVTAGSVPNPLTVAAPAPTPVSGRRGRITAPSDRVVRPDDP